jgi:hypothetical protein
MEGEVGVDTWLYLISDSYEELEIAALSAIHQVCLSEIQEKIGKGKC